MAMIPRRLRLDSLRAVRLEMTRIYKAGRDNEIPTKDMSRLIYALDKIGALLQAERQADDFDRRLSALEAEADYGHH